MWNLLTDRPPGGRFFSEALQRMMDADKSDTEQSSGTKPLAWQALPGRIVALILVGAALYVFLMLSSFADSGQSTNNEVLSATATPEALRQDS